MKFTRPLTLLLLATLASQAETAKPLYLVVGQTGQCQKLTSHKAEPIKLLSYLSAQDQIQCPAHSSLTITSVVDGGRYQISEGTVALAKLVPNEKTIKALQNDHGQRKGIEVSHQVDMSKYGGYTSRSLSVRTDAPIPVSIETLPLTLDLSIAKRKLEGSNPMVRYRKVNEHGYPSYTRAVVSPDGRLTLPDLQIPAVQTVMIFFGDPEKGDNHEVEDSQAAFAVTLLDPTLAKSVKTLRTGDLASELEAFENYCTLELYWRARELRDRLLKEHPESKHEIDELFKKWIDPSA